MTNCAGCTVCAAVHGSSGIATARLRVSSLVSKMAQKNATRSFPAGRAITFIQEIITSAARTGKSSILLAELFFVFVALAHQLDGSRAQCFGNVFIHAKLFEVGRIEQDRKSTRLNSSHQIISYAVFCLKKKKADQNSRSYVPTCSNPSS